MSVIVKGMEMPRDCPACSLSYWANHSTFLGCRAVPGKRYAMQEEQYRESDTPPDWCPLRPLPEKHGRLIDAKVLDVAFTALRFNDDGTLRHWDDRKNWCLHGGEVESLIADAPTIVEAEGE